MKEFIKYTLATIVGIILFSILMGGFAIASLAGMMASMNTATPVKDNSVLVLNLSGMMQERSSESTLSALMSDTNTALGLDDMLTAVKKAKGDKRIKGIYIEAGMFTADSYASMQALRNALLDFKKSGKWIVAYGDTYTQGTYYLASVANELVLNPQGQIDWHGIAAQPFFLKDMLAKVGVKVQLAKVGAYKSYRRKDERRKPPPGAGLHRRTVAKRVQSRGGQSTPEHRTPQQLCRQSDNFC